MRAIRSATVLLVDDLVGDGVLRYTRTGARVAHVGKRGGCASTPQAFIERLMIGEVPRGERVVWLKGGDPLFSVAAARKPITCGRRSLAADTPVAVVQNASLPVQRQVCCQLGEMAATLKRERFGGP